jgi:hypothetical protein
MSAVRTQIYLTPEQRKRLDDLVRRERKPLAQVIRDAIDAYLASAGPDPEEALSSTFGSMPGLTVPSRDEWDRG